MDCNNCDKIRTLEVRLDEKQRKLNAVRSERTALKIQIDRMTLSSRIAGTDKKRRK
jgi:hypothetical protein